jgi:cell division protease FtsH
MSGSDFVQMYVGVGASRIRNLFSKAKKSEKAVIFIDEIDAIGKKRARNVSASNDERDQTLNALLTEMSGFHDNQGIIVIGATNRLDTLDEALLRPGRFDRHIEIGLPDVNARKHILSLYAKKKPLAEDVELENLAKSTVYFSGAMLENLLNEAAINAANDGEAFIRNEHIEKAFYTVIAGAPKTDRSYITDRDRKITAYHEAGHALATKLLLPDHYISKVTIIPSVRGAGGFNLSIPKDTMFQSQRQLKANIQVLLAGRVAEELIFGAEEVTTGASNDIMKASQLIVDYLNKFGMDAEMGLFSMEVIGEGHDSQLITKCRTQMNELYEETKKLIEIHLPQLENITTELLEMESLNGEDIERICA